MDLPIRTPLARGITVIFTLFLFFLLVQGANANYLLTPDSTTNTIMDTGKNPYGVAVGNIDTDAYDEIAVANFGGESISVYNYQSGAWATSSYTTNINSTSSNPITLDVGDITGDGANDIVVADEWNHRIIIYPNDQNGGFITPTTTFSTGSLGWTHLFDLPHKVLVGDYNGDNYDDVAISNFDMAYKPVAHSAYLPTGSHQEEIEPIEAPSIKFDLNYYSALTESYGVISFSKLTDTGWESVTSYDGSAAELPAEVQLDKIGDGTKIRITWVSADTDCTLLGHTFIYDKVLVFLQRPSVHDLIPAKFKYYGYDKSGAGYALGNGDLNFDGKADDLAAPYFKYPPEETPYSNYYLRRPTDSYQTVENLLFHYTVVEQSSLMGNELVDIDVADLNGDMRDDLAIADYRYDRIDVFPQSKMNWFDTNINYNVMTRPLSLVCGDINDDARADVVATNGESNSISVLSQKPYSPLYAWTDPLEQSKNFFTPYPCIYGSAIGNFFGSAMNEVVVGSSTANKIMIYEQSLPAPPSISSDSGGSFSSAPILTLAVPHDLNGILGYYWLMDQNSASVPDASDNYTGGFTPSTQLNLGSLSDGNYWFHAVSVDKAGHIGTSAAHYPIVIDSTAPPIPVPDDGLDGATNHTPVTFSWAHVIDTPAASGTKGYYYKLNAGTESFTVQNSVVLEIPNGSHTFYVRSVDNAGNGSAYGTHDVTLDTVAPTIAAFSINDGDSFTDTTAATLNIEANGDPFQMRFTDSQASLALAPWQPFNSTASYSLPAGEGLKQVWTQLRDTAGNLSSTSVDSITIDTTPPSAPNLTKLAVNQNAPGASDSVLGSSGAVASYCYVAIYSDALLTNPVSVGLAKFDGSFDPIGFGDNLLSTIYVAAVDDAGNESGTVSLNNDIVPPPAPTLNPLPSITNASSLMVSGNAEPGVRVQVIDLYVTIATPYVASDGTYSSSANFNEGVHVISAKATDYAGNVGPSSPSIWITFDRTSPVVNISKLTLSQNAPGIADSVSGSAGCVEGNSLVQAFSDSGLSHLVGTVAASSDGSFSGIAIGDNQYSSIYLCATDVAGNSSGQVSLTNDISYPSLNLSALADNSYFNTASIPVSGIVSDSGSVDVTVNGSAATVAGGKYYGTALLNENEVGTITIRAVDQAGNATEISRTVTVDTLDPDVELVKPDAGGYIKNQVYTSFNSSDTGGSGLKNVKIYLDSTLLKTCVDSNGAFYFDSTEFKSGSHSLKAVSTDKAGNSVIDTNLIYIDNYKPVIKSLGLSRTSFRPSAGQKIAINYVLKEAFNSLVAVNFKIYSHSKLVRVLNFPFKRANPLGAGNRTVWDGKKGMGTLVSPGLCSARMTVMDKAGNKTVRVFSIAVKK